MSIVYFQSEKELIHFCEVLFRSKRMIDVEWIYDKHLGNQLHLKNDAIEKDEIITCLASVFIFYRMRQLLIEIIEKTYFYTNDSEIESIYEHTLEVLKLPFYADRLFGTGVTLKEYISYLFHQQLQSGRRVYFDSIVTFCLRPFKNLLIDSVALGIDELKREEEYQDFLDSVRAFLKHRTNQINTLHILQGEQFAFYKESGKAYSILELQKLMKKSPLYMIGLDENEWNLSPVITLSPRKIYIYGNDPTEPKTISLINVFQEKVEFLSEQNFPFQKV